MKFAVGLILTLNLCVPAKVDSELKLSEKWCATLQEPQRGD